MIEPTWPFCLWQVINEQCSEANSNPLSLMFRCFFFLRHFQILKSDHKYHIIEKLRKKTKKYMFVWWSHHIVEKLHHLTILHFCWMPFYQNWDCAITEFNFIVLRVFCSGDFWGRCRAQCLVRGPFQFSAHMGWWFQGIFGEKKTYIV